MKFEFQDGGNLFLIGYRCTGKSSVGRLLAATLGRLFVDTDLQLVAENRLSIREIVESRGWDAFRRLERSVLKQVCSMDRQVVATGGGVVLDALNIELMKESGRVIWLKATPDTVKIRMMQDRTSDGFRPALTAKDSISEIDQTMVQRQPLYQRAMDFAVNTDQHGIQEICDIIIGNLKTGSG